MISVIFQQHHPGGLDKDLGRSLGLQGDLWDVFPFSLLSVTGLSVPAIDKVFSRRDPKRVPQPGLLFKFPTAHFMTWRC